MAIDQAGPTIRKSGQALLVEGYFDAILLHQAGLTNAVALCSASLTGREQVKLLRRFEAQEIVLILDGDDAGRRGVTRAAAALLSTAMPTPGSSSSRPEKTPDDHVLKVGGDAFKREIAAAQPLTEHTSSRAPFPRARARASRPASRDWPSSSPSWPRCRKASSAPFSSPRSPSASASPRRH